MTKKIEDILTSEVYSLYSGLLALSDLSLLVADDKGRIIYEFIPSPDFCKYVCQEAQDHICADCLAHMEGREGGTFVCEKGLRNIVVPIREEGNIIGYLLGSRVYDPDTEYQKFMLNLSEMAKARHIDAAFAAKTVAMLGTSDEAKIRAHEQLCTYMAQSISRVIKTGTGTTPMQSIEKDMLERRIIDLEAKDSELHVTPHFLFNSLNCIARVAYFEHAPQTEELIYHLSDILRYHMQSGQSLHTIQAELDSIEKYLFIQKARFKSRLQYQIEVPDSVRACRIPNMILLPLVENAITHGIAPKRDGGSIIIAAQEVDEHIEIRVSDNGNGFSREAHRAFPSANEVKEETNLQRIHQRIRQYYGEEYGLRLEKSDYSGTVISCTISKTLTAR